MKKADIISGGGATNLLGNVEEVIITAINWLRLGLEIAGALMIAVGAVVAITLFIRALINHGRGDFHTVRLVFARYLSLALEFQLGADILSTAVAPSWDQIGKLAAIAVIRTGLNYFLMLEMRDEAAAQDEAAGNPEPSSHSRDAHRASPGAARESRPQVGGDKRP